MMKLNRFLQSKHGETISIFGYCGKGISIRDKFLSANIPYDDIDPEMIEILGILNFQLGIKTQFCCYGHKRGESTHIVFDDTETDENVIRLLEAVDNNVGTSGVKRIRLFKWARTMYQPNYQKPWYPRMNWKLVIDYVSDEQRNPRLNKLTEAIRNIK